MFDRRPTSAPLLFAASSIVGFGACSVPEAKPVALETSRAEISSAAANILDFEFEAEVVAAADSEARRAIVSQLLYVQGILGSDGSGNAQIGRVQLTRVVESPSADGTSGTKRIAYAAVLPVAWPKGKDLPSTYEIVLPRDTTRLASFNATYDGRCGSAGHGQDAFWFDWNPRAEGCSVEDTDVTKVQVTVGASTRATEDRYPEYDLIWSDGRLDVVALFGIIESNTPRDWAFVGARSFVNEARRQLDDVSVATGGASSSVLEDTTVTGKLWIDGRERVVKVDVLVVPKELSQAGADFETRYGPLSEQADLLLYNGHAGLGTEINAFGRAGNVVAGKYQIALLNGCQTFAYIDTTMTDRRRAANGESDPDGTRYLDVVANALTSRTENFVSTSNSLFGALLHVDSPQRWSDILGRLPEGQIAVVFGEEDNRYTP